MKDTAKRIVRFGIQNYLRNGWLSMASTLMMAMTLFIVSVFALQLYVIKTTTRSIQDKLDMAVYINDIPSEDQVSAFIEELKRYPEVKEVAYYNKEQVMQEWNNLHVDSKIKSQVNAENNPLPRTIKLKAHDPEALDAVANRITQSSFSDAKYIRNLSYSNNRPVIQKLIAQSKKITQNGIIIGAIFTFIALLFIYNTIRIVIHFRQEEIAIMKLVGATDSFVRGPFIIEGSLYGILAGVLTLIALYFFLQNGLSESVSTLGSSDTVIAQEVFQVFKSNFPMIALVMIGGAMGVSIICSYVSLHHHLKQ
jgi:cell division transport system permease protein